MFSQANYKELFKMNSAHEEYSKKYSEVSPINSLDEQLIYQKYLPALEHAGSKPFANFT